MRAVVAALTLSVAFAARTKHLELSVDSGAEDETFCEDAACCKEIAGDSDTQNKQICDDFYNPEEGVGFAMLHNGLWKRESNGKHSFFHRAPLPGRDDGQQFCTSISHSGKAACPYPGSDGYGVILGVSQRFDFWKFFQECKGRHLTGQCTDGYRCAYHSRQPISNWTYEEFKAQKNAIVKQTGTHDCKNHNVKQYNEFDTNGLSARSVAGLFVPHCLSRKKHPEEAQVCRALQMIKSKKANWPVFHYIDAHGSGRSSLRIVRYLNCTS